MRARLGKIPPIPPSPRAAVRSSQLPAGCPEQQCRIDRYRDAVADEATDQLAEKLKIRRALGLAAERTSELFELLYASADRDSAKATLVLEWDLDDDQAEAILDTPSSDYTADQRARAVARAQQLAHVLTAIDQDDSS